MQFAIVSIWIFQGLLMMVDEFYFHHKRGLDKWERVGHPVDTFFFLLCFLFCLFVPFTQTSLVIFCLLSSLSCLIVTKDEFVHAEQCEAIEQWLHSLLFIIHPVSLFALYKAWSGSFYSIIWIQVGIIFLFLCYQIIFWNFIKREAYVEKT